MIKIAPRKLEDFEKWADWKSLDKISFTPLPSTQYKIDRSKPEFLQNLERPEFLGWGKNTIITDITIKGKVVHGF